jgi:PLP dependent protein
MIADLKSVYSCIMTTISSRLLAVQNRIAAACKAAGRDPSHVQLLAVSKTFGADAVVEAMAVGQLAFGENYIAEAVEKIQALRNHPGLVWHCIGPIQSNKTRPVAEHFDWVQSVDRLKIAQRLSEQRPAHMPPLQICLQVNVDGGANKSGVAPNELMALAEAVIELPNLTLRGLMTIPEPAIDFEAARAAHSKAKALFDALNQSAIKQNPRFNAMDTLSIGMSADIEAAIASGSTLVRVGTAIFGAR